MIHPYPVAIPVIIAASVTVFVSLMSDILLKITIFNLLDLFLGLVSNQQGHELHLSPDRSSNEYKVFEVLLVNYFKRHLSPLPFWNKVQPASECEWCFNFLHGSLLHRTATTLPRGFRFFFSFLKFLLCSTSFLPAATLPGPLLDFVFSSVEVSCCAGGTSPLLCCTSSILWFDK